MHEVAAKSASVLDNNNFERTYCEYTLKKLYSRRAPVGETMYVFIYIYYITF